MKVVPMEETTLTVREFAELVKDGTVILTRSSQPLRMSARSSRRSATISGVPGHSAAIMDKGPFDQRFRTRSRGEAHADP